MAATSCCPSQAVRVRLWVISSRLKKRSRIVPPSSAVRGERGEMERRGRGKERKGGKGRGRERKEGSQRERERERAFKAGAAINGTTLHCTEESMTALSQVAEAGAVTRADWGPWSDRQALPSESLLLRVFFGPSESLFTSAWGWGCLECGPPAASALREGQNRVRDSGERLGKWGGGGGE